jgi:hypothetical protein
MGYHIWGNILFLNLKYLYEVNSHDIVDRWIYWLSSNNLF